MANRVLKSLADVQLYDNETQIKGGQRSHSLLVRVLVLVHLAMVCAMCISIRINVLGHVTDVFILCLGLTESLLGLIISLEC